jgi:serine phosphatase RsbU (regulator of sigma subunit)
LGRIAPAPEVDPLNGEESPPAKRGDPRESLSELERQFAATDSALTDLTRFLAGRDMSRLPGRLAEDLEGARAHLGRIHKVRTLRTRQGADLEAVLAFYRTSTQGLIGATAALNELSDDGDLLRTVNSLVTVLELAERTSEEHALLAHVLERQEFPPGSYRNLVILHTEEETLSAVFRTNASTDQVELFASIVKPELRAETRAISQAALDATADRVQGDPATWFDKQEQRVVQLGAVANELNERVGKIAVAKRDSTRQVVWLGGTLATAVLLFSAFFAWFIARGISRAVSELRITTERVANGDLEARVTLEANDELGTLGRAFNEMIGEVASARLATEERARMGRELEIAASIQRQLLPRAPTHPDFEFAGRMVPADEVGGDFYDIQTGPDGSLWLTVGDVSSHGLSAGLVMVMAQTAFASHFHRDAGTDPDEVLRGVNRVLQANISDRLQENKYLTAQLLTYRGEGTFRCAGAHEWPLVFRRASGQTELIETPGPWLGIVPALDEVPLLEVHLEPGDVLCLYSDGLTEARNESGELFDLTRFREILAQALSLDAPLETAVERVFATVAEHASVQDDDWSLLLARRKPG